MNWGDDEFQERFAAFGSCGFGWSVIGKELQCSVTTNCWWSPGGHCRLSPSSWTLWHAVRWIHLRSLKHKSTLGPHSGFVDISCRHFHFRSKIPTKQLIASSLIPRRSFSTCGEAHRAAWLAVVCFSSTVIQSIPTTMITHLTSILQSLELTWVLVTLIALMDEADQNCFQPSTPLEGFTHVTPIPIPAICDTACCGVCPEGPPITVQGWGRIDDGSAPEFLRQVDKDIMPLAPCNAAWLASEFNIPVSDSMFCTVVENGR